MISTAERGEAIDPMIGRVLDGRYRVCRTIGRGGMGVVYEAQHLLIGRKVAIKTMAAHAFSNAAIERFRREARAAAAVGNSHIVDVLDMGQLDAGSLFIVLEHLDGRDLGFAVASERRLSVGRAVHIVSQLCDALSAVHAAGIVHRDLKPDNVFLISRDGESDFVKVLDFGVCKISASGVERLTFSGDRVGTPQFMAPEQIEGRAEIDPRTDIFALGSILYFALTGKPPFDADNLARLALKICNDPAPSARQLEPAVPAELDRIIARALCKEPEQRFQSCQELKSALAGVAIPVPNQLSPSPLEGWDTLPDVGARRGDTLSVVPLVDPRPRRRAIASTVVLGIVAVCSAALAGRWRSPPDTANVSGGAALAAGAVLPGPSDTRSSSAAEHTEPQVAPVDVSLPPSSSACASCGAAGSAATTRERSRASLVANRPELEAQHHVPAAGSGGAPRQPTGGSEPSAARESPALHGSPAGSSAGPPEPRVSEPAEKTIGSLPLNRDVKRDL